MSKKDNEIIVPIPEDQREILTEKLKAYKNDPKRKALKKADNLRAEYGQSRTTLGIQELQKLPFFSYPL